MKPAPTPLTRPAIQSKPLTQLFFPHPLEQQELHGMKEKGAMLQSTEVVREPGDRPLN